MAFKKRKFKSKRMRSTKIKKPSSIYKYRIGRRYGG